MTVDPAVQANLETIANQSQIELSQVAEVFQTLSQAGDLGTEIILRELDLFYSKLGVDRYYFQVTHPSLIAQHISAFYAARLLSKAGGEGVALRLQHETDNIAIYACPDAHNIAIEIERYFEEKYPSHRLQSYRTTGSFATGKHEHLRLYFLTAAEYVCKDDVPLEETDILKVGCQDFLNRTTVHTIERYQDLLRRAVDVRGPLIEFSDKPDSNEVRLMIAYKRDRAHSYFSAVSDVLNAYDLHSNRKYIEQFANGIVVYSIYIDQGTALQVLDQIREDLSLMYVLPRTALSPLFREGKLTAPEIVYAYAGWKFVHQFMTRYSDAYNSLASVLQNDPVRLGLLNNIKTRLGKDTFTEARILETILAYPGVIKALYNDFASHHLLTPEFAPYSFDLLHNEELVTQITKAVSSDLDRLILLKFLTFNRHILKTNFYRNVKTSIAFRLDPSFLSKADYPEKPFGIFFVIGSEFRGFHIRFRDVARGGIRIISSPNLETQKHNIDQLFNENYRLAHTQQRKNKDIPEGGSKGVILLSFDFRHRRTLAFKKYIGGIIDLMMPNEEIADHYGKEELLFLGPDEHTADLMDWASQYARSRGYRFWKAFTTGKSQLYGGIPHDLFGMTTRSVHQYVLGILRKEGLEESAITKFQTGGPDGDLGSNEIKISIDKTLSVVDGSGVLHDPNGIDRTELLRLAEARMMARHFDLSRLGPGGFFIDIEDRDVVLPNGTKVESGLKFRNDYHLMPISSADLFVPCGGRPSAVHINNVDKLLDEKGQPRFKYIVEGANLFFSQEARQSLENAGVIIYKDASANKGGVTSSSLEVLAGLSFNDEEFAQHMQVQPNHTPAFYQQYVEDVKSRIERNAALEFECIWQEHERTGTDRSILTDLLSNKINELTDRISASSLWTNESLRKRVLLDAIPRNLVELVDYDTLRQRIPSIYLQAIFASYLASLYVYRYGLPADEVSFFEFIQDFQLASSR